MQPFWIVCHRGFPLRSASAAVLLQSPAFF
jgi:hypothetical protein